jgi:hypothetical protein
MVLDLEFLQVGLPGSLEFCEFSMRPFRTHLRPTCLNKGFHNLTQVGLLKIVGDSNSKHLWDPDHMVWNLLVCEYGFGSLTLGVSELLTIWEVP